MHCGTSAKVELVEDAADHGDFAMLKDELERAHFSIGRTDTATRDSRQPRRRRFYRRHATLTLFAPSAIVAPVFPYVE